MSDVTRILNAIEGGDAKASNELLPLVYEELRILAAKKLSHERPGQTLQATALVHAAYLRFLGTETHGWDGSGHFFAAAEAMRRTLVDNARHKKTYKHGGHHNRVNLTDADISAEKDIALECLKFNTHIMCLGVYAVEDSLKRISVLACRRYTTAAAHCLRSSRPEW